MSGPNIIRRIRTYHEPKVKGDLAPALAAASGVVLRSRPVTKPLDLGGLKCPLVVLKIRRAMAAVAPGGTLAAIADDPMALVDVPVMCHHLRFDLREAKQAADGRIHFLIEKPRGWVKPANPGPMK